MGEQWEWLFKLIRSSNEHGLFLPIVITVSACGWPFSTSSTFTLVSFMVKRPFNDSASNTFEAVDNSGSH